jgi:uncharacterized protein (TIGR03437 family)
MRMPSRLSSICLVLVLPFTAAGQSVLTANYDNARTNSNLAETVLTPGNVGPGSFGKLFALSVDGQIYTQPLFMPALSIGGAAHNAVFVATMHNSVYAFDGDGPATPLWTVNLGPSIPASTFDFPGEPYADVESEIGILGTPVIDASTGTLYAVAGTLESAGNGNSAVFYRLHALDVTTGAERFGAPVEIGGSVTGVGDNSSNGLVTFDPAQHIQRPGLALANGVVYVSFGSHSDAAPYHGWLFAYSAGNVRNQVAVYNPTPNGSGGALWQSGRAPAIDSAGSIYVVSGNGDTDGLTSFSDSMLKLNPGSLSLTDWFAPSNVQTLNGSDDDLGAMGPMLIPNTGFVVTGGKQGILYLLDRTKLGNLSSTDTQIPQKFRAVSFGIFNAALWPRSGGGATLYLHGGNSPVQSWTFNGSGFLRQPASQSIGSFNVPFQGMAISANGSRRGTGVLWVITANSYPLPSTGTIRAYDADDLTSELWDSGMNSADAAGEFIKFANPTVANGKVYVPTGSKQLLVYGLVAGNNPAPAITAVTNAASYAAGPVAPGELLTIFGQNLGPANIVQGQWSLGNILAEQAAGVEVTFNGMPAPILYASSNTIATIAPFALKASSQVAIQVGVNGVMSPVQNLPVAAAAPGIFSFDSSGNGPGVILNTDYSINSAANPAPVGSAIMIYATGGGMTAGQNTTGRTARAAAALHATVSATVGGEPASVLYAGSAPDQANGVIQVNLQLPAGVIGIAPVVLTIGGLLSQATVTVAIR